VLYAYDDVANVPAGCAMADAATVVPREHLFVHDEPLHAGSVAAFSDLFRYLLLERDGGWWVDTDVICLSDAIPDDEYVFAEQEPGLYNGAVLRAPAGSLFLRAARARAESVGAAARHMSIGPALVTELVAELGLEDRAWEPALVYPLGWRQALDVLDPRQVRTVEERCAGSLFLHVWNEILRVHNVLKTVRPPAGSFLARMYDAYEIPFPEEPRYDFPQLEPQITLQREHWLLCEEIERLRAELYGSETRISPAAG
jgi:hypothetical protein